MSFAHIHCSSRFDRPASALESDLDNWMAHSSLITMTEVNNDNRAAKLQEKGWGHYNATLGGGRDDCAIAWDKSVWHLLHRNVTRLSVHPVPGKNNQVYACTVGLRHVADGKKLLASVTHMPAHVETSRAIGDNPSGHIGRSTTDDLWKLRKRAYLSSLKTWSTHVKGLDRKHRADATLVTADWNINLKLIWAHQLLKNNWGEHYRMAWKDFPTQGGSMTGGPTPPPGAPGRGYGDRIIDGSLYRRLKVTDEPVLMPRVRSSDHRPFNENFAFLGANEHQGPDDSPHGDIKHGDEWWGFGDYLNDEIYAIPTATGDVGGEVL